MQQSAPAFFCDVQPDRERVIVRLGGELDVATAPAVAAAVGELLDAGFGRLVVDLRALSFVDSAGIHTLLSAQRSAAERRRALSVIRGPEQVQRAFVLTGAEPLLAFEPVGASA